MRLLHRLAPTVLACLSCAAAVWAQDAPDVGPPQEDPDRPVVVSVEFTGLLSHDEQGVLAALGVAQGQRWPDQLAYRQGVQRVWETYGVVLLRPVFETVPGGVAVRLPVREMPVDLEPRFVGNQKMPEEKLREWALLFDREEIYIHEADRVRRRLINGYLRQGFAHVEVDVVVGGADQPDQPDQAEQAEQGEAGAPGAGTDVIFEIREGPRVRVTRVEVRGNEHLPDTGWGFWRGGLRRLAEVEVKGRGMLRWWGTRFDREVLEADLVAMRQVYRERGWMDAKVELVDLVYSDDRSRVVVHVLVDEGPLYHVRSVELEAVDREPVEDPERWRERPAELLFPEEELLGLLELEPGHPLESARILNDRSELGRYYGERGYIPQDYFEDPLAGGWDWLEPLYLFDTVRHEVDVVYRIVQGRQRSVREVKLRGNLHTRDRVLRRELSVQSQQPNANIREIERGLARLRGTSYFDDQLDTSHPPPEVHLEVTADDPDQVNVIYSVTEGRVVDVNLASGVTSDSGLLGLVSVSMRNFEVSNPPRGFWSGFGEVRRKEAWHGNGETFMLDLAPGSEISYYRALYAHPDLLGTHFNRWTASGEFESRLRRYRSHDEERSHVALSAGHLFGQGDLSLRFGPQWLSVEVDDLDAASGLPGTLLRSAPDSDFQGLDLELRYSKLDNRLSPREGVYMLWSNTIFGGPFGGDNDIWESEYLFDWYRLLGSEQDDVRSGVYLSGEVGVAHPFGDTKEVHYSERKFFGGASTLRGFDFRGVGPNEGAYALGGESFLRLSAEYRHPLYTTPIPGTSNRREMLRGFLFVDAGVLDTDSFSLDLDEHRASVGFGFALTSPIPLKFNFGFPIREGPGDDTEVFSFRLDFR